jgi:hypothetical protein
MACLTSEELLFYNKCQPQVLYITIVTLDLAKIVICKFERAPFVMSEAVISPQHGTASSLLHRVLMFASFLLIPDVIVQDRCFICVFPSF